MRFCTLKTYLFTKIWALVKCRAPLEKKFFYWRKKIKEKLKIFFYWFCGKYIPLCLLGGGAFGWGNIPVKMIR